MLESISSFRAYDVVTDRIVTKVLAALKTRRFQWRKALFKCQTGDLDGFFGSP